MHIRLLAWRRQDFTPLSLLWSKDKETRLHKLVGIRAAFTRKYGLSSSKSERRLKRWPDRYNTHLISIAEKRPKTYRPGLKRPAAGIATAKR